LWGAAAQWRTRNCGDLNRRRRSWRENGKSYDLAPIILRFVAGAENKNRNCNTEQKYRGNDKRRTAYAHREGRDQHNRQAK
jgi:hypothetical protein